VGSLRPWVAGAGLVAGLLAAGAAFSACRGLDAPPGRWGRWGGLAVASLGLAAARQFLGLCTSDGAFTRTLNPYNYGDLPLHWTYIRFFANGAPFWPENPIFTGIRLQYPFGSDLFAALFVQLGLPLPGILEVTGLLASAALLAGLWRWGGALAAAAFLFSGGLGDDPGLAWKNLLLALFVPQRGFLFALPAGLLLLWSFRERLLRRNRGLPVGVEGVLWGVLPLFHVHTFLMISIVGGVWAVGASAVGRLGRTLLTAFVPAAWCVLQVTDHFRAASLVWWKPGWLIGAEGPFVFLARNFGVLLPLAGWSTLAAWRARSREALLLAVPGLLLFALLFFAMLAPWEWDNTKAMIWCFLLLLPPIATLLETEPPSRRAIAVALLLLPGVPAVLRGFRGSPGLEVFRNQEMAEVCDALSDIPVAARIAAAQTFNHPAALCGHPVVAGYDGHLWSHGISASRVKAALSNLMWGRPGWQGDARNLRAAYVFWGPREQDAFSGSAMPWAEPGRRTASGSWGALYRLRE
jgi:hypothetical protein